MGMALSSLQMTRSCGGRLRLKVPRPEFILSPGMCRRFVGEAQAAAALDHPNILKVFEAGIDGSISFIAQELCTGPSLSEWLLETREQEDRESEGRVSRSEVGTQNLGREQQKLRHGKEGVDPVIAALIVRDLARGVEHAHQRGVLHRDLKPGNVLLQPVEADRGQGTTLRQAQTVSLPNGNITPAQCHSALGFTTKLADFGIAKVFDEEGDRTATATGAAIGTAAYMSPEQATGRSSQIGPASDIYGLGAILYELLTGRPPFVLDARVATLQRVIAEEPPEPHSLRPQYSS